MHIQVTNVYTPYVMPPLGPEWHLSLWTWPAWHLEVIQTPVDGKIAATGGARKLDAHLLKSRTDAIGSKQWILRKFFNLLDRLHIDFAQARARMGFIFQSGKLLLGKAPENSVDCLAAHV